MRWIREVANLVRSIVRADRKDIHTSLPAQVVSYDAATNTCSIQPCIMRIRTDDPSREGWFQMPQINSVPVKQQGSGKLLLSVAPQAGSYGNMIVAQRSIETWIAEGGVVAPTSSRMHHFSDAIFDPGLYPIAVDGDNGKLPVPIATDRISLRTRAGTTEVSVLDDGSIAIKGTETVMHDGTDWAVQFTEMKSAFDTLKSDFNSLVTAYNAHIHITTATVGASPTPGVIAPTTSTGTPSTADMANAKVEEVRLP